MKKTFFVLFVLGIISIMALVSCNEGTINTPPRMSKLIIKASSTSVTGQAAMELFPGLDSFEAMNYLVANYPFNQDNTYFLTDEAALYTNRAEFAGSTMGVEVMQFFKNCSTGSVSDCTVATPASSDWEKCHSSKDGDYAMNGSSALEASCFIDSLMAFSSDQIDKCKYSGGKDITMTSLIPWLATWNVPTVASFQGVSSDGSLPASGSTETYKYFRTKPTGDDNEQYILAIENSKGPVIGYKNSTTKEFFFLWSKYSGATDYFSYGINGCVETNNFEAYKAYVNGGTTETIRIKSDGTYVYYQKFNAVNINSSTAVNEHGCFNLSTKAKVDATLCQTAFSISDASANNDTIFTLKAVDATQISTKYGEHGYDLNNLDTKFKEKLSGCFD